MATMAHQKESLPNLNRGEITPQPTETDVKLHGHRGDATLLIHNMTSDFIDVQNVYGGLDEEFASETTRYKTEESQKARRKQLEDFLIARREALVNQVNVAISDDALDIDPTLFGEAPISLSNYGELYVERELTRIRSEREIAAKALQATTERPGHISEVSRHEGDHETNRTLAEMLSLNWREIGSAVIKAVESSSSLLFSRPTKIISESTPEKIHEAEPGHPADPELLTGDVLTVTLKSIKPENLRVNA